MPEQPLVPHVLHVGETNHPWKAVPIERLAVLGDTPSGVRVEPGTLPGVLPRPGHTYINRPDHLVYCLESDAAWVEAQRTRNEWQATLDALAGALRELGRYDERLAAAGKKAPNPLTSSVFHFWVPPDRRYSSTFFWNGDVPDMRRRPVQQHTPKMIQFTDSGSAAQSHCYLCKNDSTGQRMSDLHAAAVAARQAWVALLDRLGTYGRRRSANIEQLPIFA